jgi:hypothetical protein
MRDRQTLRSFVELRMLRYLVPLALSLTWSTITYAEEKDPSFAHPHEISGGFAIALWRTYYASTPTARLFDLAYHLRPQKKGLLRSLRSTTGLRIGVGDDERQVFELYWRGDIMGSIGPWAPTLGPEIGASTLGTSFVGYSRPLPDDQTSLHAQKLGPFYLAFVATPLRFAFSRFTLSAFELSIGAPVIGIGSVSRFQVGFFSLGGTL